MNLSEEIKRYIRHKVNLANSNSPHYFNPAILMALQYCHSLLLLFCRQAQYLTAQDIARFILQNKQHLKAILPHEANKSYKTSSEKLDKILAYSQEILKPKQI